MSGIHAIVMPKWGMEMTEGTIAGWLVAPGAVVDLGMEIVEIETTKITNVYESPVAGTLRRQVAAAGAVVPCGQLIAVIADAGVSDADVDAFVTTAAEAPAAAETADAGGPLAAKTTVEGIDLNAVSFGDGPGRAILFVHGFGADWTTWMFNLTALGAARRCVAIELPGHGASDKRVPRADVPSLAALLAAFIDTQGLAPCHVVGHSLGAACALALAERHADRVASLTLIAPSGLGQAVNPDFIQGFVAAESRRDMKAVLSLLVEDPSAVTRRMIDDVMMYKRTDGVAEALAVYVRDCFPDGAPAWQARMAPAALAMPTQVIAGDGDRVIAPPAPGPGVHILVGAGHLVHMEKANEVNRLIAALAEQR